MNRSERRAAGSYVDVLQVQGVQVLVVPLPQDGWPALPHDAAGQHGALADRHHGHAQLLVVGEGQHVYVCRGSGRGD